jgi:hypothetical protein
MIFQTCDEFLKPLLGILAAGRSLVVRDAGARSKVPTMTSSPLRAQGLFDRVKTIVEAPSPRQSHARDAPHHVNPVTPAIPARKVGSETIYQRCSLYSSELWVDLSRI